MKKKTGRIIVVILMGILLFASGNAQEDQKLAQASFHFLSVTSDARAAAMANAVTSLQIGSSAMFFNPAGMSDMKNFLDVSISSNQWIADIKHSTLGVAICPFKGNYGVLGFSMQYVDYGNFIGTIVNKNIEKGYDDVGIFKLYALAVGVGYAKQLTDRFSVGGQIRWARQDLGQSRIPNEYQHDPIFKPDTSKPGGVDSTKIIYRDSAVTTTNQLSPLVFDFGTQFKTGFYSLVFGMSVRNFSKEMQYAYETFQLPLVFTLGISMNLMDLLENAAGDQSLYLSIDASHYRDHPEQLKIGLDYQVLKTFSMRCGYVTDSDEKRGFSYGVGVSKLGFAFDYSYTPFGVFNKVQRMTARFSF
jgi:hypothetical protein